VLNIFRKKKEKPSDDTFDLVKGLIDGLLGDNGQAYVLSHNTRLLDIGFDSIKFTNLLLNLEDIVDVDIQTLAEEMDLASLQTMGDIIRLVEKLRRK
jgi:acyl carrier protein